MCAETLDAEDFYHILGVKGLNPKPYSIPYWVLKRMCDQAMIPLDQLIDNKIQKYEKHIIKTLSDQIRNEVIIKEGKKITVSQLRKKIDWYLRDKQDNGTENVNKKTGEKVILKSRIEPTPFLIQKIADRIEERTKKFIIEDLQDETLDSIFKIND